MDRSKKEAIQVGLVSIVLGVVFYFIGMAYNNYSHGLVGTGVCLLFTMIAIPVGLWFIFGGILPFNESTNNAVGAFLAAFISFILGMFVFHSYIFILPTIFLLIVGIANALG